MNISMLLCLKCAKHTIHYTNSKDEYYCKKCGTIIDKPKKQEKSFTTNMVKAPNDKKR